MKKLLCLGILFNLFVTTILSQTFYETSWQSNNIKYTGLVIYYDDDDVLVRIKYVINNQNKVAEFKAFGKHFEQDDKEGYLLDGSDARIVIGQSNTGYSADNFIFFVENDDYGTPIHIDDQGLTKDDISDYITTVSYWKEIPRTTFTKSYIQSFFDEDEPLATTLLAFNAPVEIEKGTQKPQRISSVSYGDDEWVVATSEGMPVSGQSWKKSTDYPDDWISEKWDEDYYLTDLAYGAGEWVLVMSKHNDYTDQSWELNSTFPNDWIKTKWDDDFYITSVAYGEGEWAVVMSESNGFTAQSWKKSSSYPTEWVREKWDGDYYITSTAYGNGEWVIVMSKGAGFNGQSTTRNSVYPKDWIKEKWDAGYYITSITYGNGEWLVIASKGVGYTNQSWKSSSTYPQEWIKQKWNGVGTTSAPTVTNAPVDPVNVTMHLIIVANTRITDIGASCSIDKENLLKEFEDISSALKIPINKVVVNDREFGKQSVLNSINNLRPNKNDIVVFFYTGHGFRWEDQTSKYPNLSLTNSRFDDIRDASVNLFSIYESIVSKGARLNLVFGDCCNSNIGISSRGGDPSLSTRRQSQGQVEKLKQLFFHSKGNLIAAAAKPYETSCGSSRDGGYFINSFLAALDKETSSLNGTLPKWDNIIRQTISSASYKTQNLTGCDPQNGIFQSTIN